ncbi:hypothetical protein MNEG_14360 [Monoraphidium neglectum]|uniref:Uncharacterized protein n=1 Tax=Monoraphidium neglectum TaxID=145388 RepID=A0A0D2LVH2_9CHLO|nr:hypothetical protein MNEG_14360 [Monoraphidium neglectum]KIY93601.1 hypothetical protein MNEG_14360 [Monoraphidium neglectum]|eukprot:XP_013892621.1 hypothetical protein MNEG_14360 [Monoraphidium neglectum]
MKSRSALLLGPLLAAVLLASTVAEQPGRTHALSRNLLADAPAAAPPITPPAGPTPQPPAAAPHAAGGQAGGADRHWTWDWRTVVALICSVGISLIIAPGGSGGAQLYYPLFNVLLGFSIRDTAAIVSFVMFLGAIMSCSMAVAENHPTDPERRPVIDYGSVLVVAPAVLLGVAFGVIANAIVPLWLLQAASISVFSWAFIKILLPYLALRAKEKQREEAAAAIANGMRQVVIAEASGEGEGDGSGGDDDNTNAGVGAANGGLISVTGAGGARVVSPFAGAGALDGGAAPSPGSAAALSPPLRRARTGSVTLASIEKQGDPELVRAAAAALVAGALGRRGSLGAAASGAAPEDAMADDLEAFRALDAEVRALEAAALDDYPLSGALSRAFTSDADTLMLMDAIDAAAHHAGGDPVSTLRAISAARLSGRLPVSTGAASGASVVVAADAKVILVSPPAGSGAEGPAAGRRGALPARLRAWAARQPALLMVLTLAVLAQQLAFSVLQRAVVQPCTGGFYGLLGARIGVTVILAVGASVVVTRFNRSFQQRHGQHAEHQQEPQNHDQKQQQQAHASEESKPVAPVADAAAAQKQARAERRAARAAEREALRRRNWEAIQWRPRDIIEKNLAMLLIGVLGGCLGLGGGFAIAPLLLGMGLHPQCQAGTSKAILLISTLASSVSFLIAGRMAITYALV